MKRLENNTLSRLKLAQARYAHRSHLLVGHSHKYRLKNTCESQMEKRFPSTYCKVYLPFLHLCIYIPEIPITSETLMIHLSDDLLIPCSRWTLAAWNLGCHCFRDFHCHVTRIIIIKQRWWQTQQKEKSNDNTAVAGRFFSLFSPHTSKHANNSHAGTSIISSCS